MGFLGYWSRVSPEWPKPQTAESRVSEEKTRDSLVTRRTHSPLNIHGRLECVTGVTNEHTEFPCSSSSASIEELMSSSTRH